MQIEEERKRIAKVHATPIEKLGGEASKKGKLIAMHKYLEELKILADINDPVVKKRFEDGDGTFALTPSHSERLPVYWEREWTLRS